jgi:outer membrane protein assembly factor BamB
MYHGDASHSGLSQSMPDVSGALKVIASIKLDGAVCASPIAVDGVIVVATENDSVYAYAYDPQGKLLWHVSVGSPSPAYQRPCGNIGPLGITGTPVYRAQTSEVYLVAEHGGTAGHDLIALDLHTGTTRAASSASGSTAPGPRSHTSRRPAGKAASGIRPGRR